MSNFQFFVAVAIAPVMSLVILLAGNILQNTNLNARNAELRAELKDLLKAELGAIRAEVAALRAEMEKNHSELLMKLTEQDRRISQLEPRR